MDRLSVSSNKSFVRIAESLFWTKILCRTFVEIGRLESRFENLSEFKHSDIRFFISVH